MRTTPNSTVANRFQLLKLGEDIELLAGKLLVSQPPRLRSAIFMARGAGITLLIVHGLCAVLLIGALTHQVLALFWSFAARPTNFLQRARSVRAPSYARAVTVLFVITVLLGAVIYPIYTLGPRPGFKVNMPPAFGLFEIKEHFGALGIAMLPAYWRSWRGASDMSSLRSDWTAQRMLTVLLAFIVWYDFLSGHVLNNLGGL